MAINVKITLIFNAGKSGWTETWYKNSTTLDDAASSSFPALTARAGLLGKGSVLEAVRYSDEDVLNDSLLVEQVIAANNAPGPALIRDNPSNAWLCQARSGNQYRRQVWLRGMPDDWIAFDPTTFQPIIIAAFQTAFNKFAAAAIKAVWQIRALAKEGGIAPITPVAGVAVDPSGVIQITAPGHGLVNTNNVRVRGLKGDNIKSVNGVWQVYGVTVNTFLIPKLATSVPGMLYKGGGTVQKRVFNFYNIDSIRLLRPSKHNTGRAFFVSRGRRKVVRPL